MGATTEFTLPWPEPADAPDVPGDMQALAVATESAIQGVRTILVAADTSLDGRMDVAEGKITDIYTKIPTAKVKMGVEIVTTNSVGQASVPHNAGWVPSVILCTPGKQNAGKGLILAVDTDPAPTASTFRIEVWFVEDTASYGGGTLGPYISQSVRVYYLIRD